MLTKLYEEYGRLMVDAEIINSRIIAVKQQIATAINKQQHDSSGKQPGTENDKTDKT